MSYFVQPTRPAAESFSRDLIYPLRSILERLELKDLFPIDQPLEIELGSGDGSFLVHYAAGHPERNFIGVERLLGRIRKLERKGRRLGLTNLRGLRIESSYFLEYLLPPHSAAAMHVYFPDPWPKRKHRRHRLVNERFVGLAHGVLETGGMVYLRTDDAEYFEQMVGVFTSITCFRSADSPSSLLELKTDFEVEFNARGIQTLSAAFRAV